MIIGLRIKELRTAEFCQFLEDVLAIVGRNEPVKLEMQEQYDALLVHQQAVFRFIGHTTKSPFTQELDAIDERRDKAYRGIRGLVEAMTLHYDNATAQHARQLSHHLSLFGAVDREGDISETAIISNLVQQWTNKPPLAEAVTALGLTGWQQELEAANKVYEERKLDKIRAISTAPKETFKARRVAATKAYSALRNRLAAAYVVYDAAEPYQKIINTLNVLISDYKNILTRRKGTAKNGAAAKEKA